jgi:hypothetical protein
VTLKFINQEFDFPVNLQIFGPLTDGSQIYAHRSCLQMEKLKDVAFQIGFSNGPGSLRFGKKSENSKTRRKNIQWVPLKPTCVSFEIQAPNNKSMKDSRRTRNYMIEETGRNCSVVEVATKVSQDHDKNPYSSHNNHIITLL